MTEIITDLSELKQRRMSPAQREMAEEMILKGAKVISPLPEGAVLNKDDMVPIYHWHTGMFDEPGCKQVAFYYTHYLQKGEVLMATRALMPDNTRPDRNSPMVCGSCGAPLRTRGDLSVYQDRYSTVWEG